MFEIFMRLYIFAAVIAGAITLAACGAIRDLPRYW